MPHAHADLTTSATIHLAAGARLVWSEVLSPGRLHRGERFAHQQVRSSLDVYREGALVARERQVLCPAAGDVESRLGGYTHVGTVYGLGEGFSHPLPASACRGDLDMGLSVLAVPGFFARVLGLRAEDVLKACAALALTESDGLRA